MEIAAILALAAAGATVQGSLGVGFALVAGPGLVAIDPSFAPGPLLFIGQVVGARHILAERHHADMVAWRHCLWGLPFGMIGGLIVLVSVTDRMLGLLVGGLTALAALTLLAGRSIRRTRRVEIAAGASCAFAAVTAGLPGPPLVVVFSDMKPATMRSTASMFIGVIAVLAFGALVATGNFGRTEFGLLVLLLPGTLGGLLAARYVRSLVDRPIFRTIVLVIALLGGLGLVLRSI